MNSRAPAIGGSADKGLLELATWFVSGTLNILPDNFKIGSPSPSNFGTERRSATSYIRFTGTNINVRLFIEI